MKKIRKLLKILIVLAVLISSSNINLWKINSVEATTNGYTPDTAIEYVKSLLGQQISVDEKYPGECVDLIMAYERELSGVYYSRKWMRLCI